MQVFPTPASSPIQDRILALVIFFCGAYLLLLLRFAFLQIGPHGSAPANRDIRTIALPARRGDILDRNGLPLAVTIDAYDVWVRPKLIRSRHNGQMVADALSRTLKVDPARLAVFLDENKPFVYVRRHVNRVTGEAIRKLHLQELGADATFQRVYPQHSLAAQLVGRVNTDGKGTAGAELGYNSLLQGTPGIRQFRVDGRSEPIPGTELLLRNVENGKSIQLTIDGRIQQMAEARLKQSVEEHHAAAGCTVVMDVQTGEILAMASRPTFDPNEPVADMNALLNRPISYAYEPGSTLKMVTAAASLQEKSWNLQRTVTCTGSMTIGRRRIRCVIEPPFKFGHGTETLRDIIRNSCNVGAATVGMSLGGERLYAYLQKFGLLDRPRIGLPGAVAYRLSPPDKWARVKLANVAFGQGVMVTPLQLLGAYASIANGGTLMAPQLISGLVDPDQRDVAVMRKSAVRRVVSPEVAQQVVQLLEAVVYDGTGKPAQLPGYTVAGKTGSAQKAGNHGYLPGKYVASFVGFAPASHPRIACLTMIDEPQGIHWGAVCAAPVVRDVLRWSLHYLQTPPDAPQLFADGAIRHTIDQQEHRYGKGGGIIPGRLTTAARAPGRAPAARAHRILRSHASKTV